MRAGRTVHAYLFAGPRGTGKTTTARLLAKALNCQNEDPSVRPCNDCELCRSVNESRFLDLIEIDAASNTSVDDVRDLRDKINFRPGQGERKVYLIDEVHMLSTAAFNALLKTLEEPPPHAVFILATTEIHKVPATVLSRCQRHEFRRIPSLEIAGYLQTRCQAESLSAEPAALGLIARSATGSLRDAISLLDQLASTGEDVSLTRTQDLLGAAGGDAVAGLVDTIAAGEVGVGLAAIQEILDGGADPRQLARQVVDHLRGVLMVLTGQAGLVDAPVEARQAMERQAQTLSLETVLAGLRAFGRSAAESRPGPQPALGLELALIDTVQPEERPRPSAPPPAAAPPTARPASTASPARPAGKKPEQSAEAVVAEAEPGAPARAGEVARQWEAILEAAYRLDTRTQALLRSGRMLGVQSGRVVLGFPTEILREKMEKGHSLTYAQQAIEQVVGARLEVRCVLIEQWSAQDEPSESQPMEDDGMVATAVRELGGQVVAVRPAPRQDSTPNA